MTSGLIRCTLDKFSAQTHREERFSSEKKGYRVVLGRGKGMSVCLSARPSCLLPPSNI